MKHLSIASLCSILVVFAISFIVCSIDAIQSKYSDIRLSLIIAGAAALVACVVIVVWAIPVHFVLSKLNQRSFAWYMIAAIIPSFIFIYVFKPFGEDSSIDLLKQALFCSFCGGFGAWVFWYISVYRQGIKKISLDDK